MNSTNFVTEDFLIKLFCRGYLITTNPSVDLNTFRFLKEWQLFSISDYRIYVHPQQHFFCKTDKDSGVFLIGNCLNPFTGQYSEDEILSDILSAVQTDKESAINKINELTGSFFIGYISSDDLYFITDPTEMLFSTYATINQDLYISSHYQLIADICNLEKDSYTRKLEKYRYFYKYGLFFPGNRTPYKKVHRVLTNHLYHFRDNSMGFTRIYPTEKITQCKTEEEYQLLIRKVYDILESTMACAAEKWNTPSISLTGGMDSKTTLSATKNIRDKFCYYSYFSMDGDKIDADAAHKISEHLGIEHVVYDIPKTDEELADCNLEQHRKILEHCMGGYLSNPNDVRKRVYFNEYKPFDVEIKSWVSEVGRANYYKKFGLKKMPEKLTPRHMTSMYKVFITERKLAKETDAIFEKFIKTSGFDKLPEGYDASDLYLWEFRYSAWGGLVITAQHSYSGEIFIPYNNRLLLDLMLTAPMEKRISDRFHEDLIEYGDSRISELGINITNWNETKARQKIEKCYFLLSSWLNKL